ncbi:FAD-binding Berberine family protein [Euphorbia peplus]|nr:FAD-binding Berberine family protein [Euphorbia peplus]
MATSKFVILLVLVTLLVSSASSASVDDSFVQCFSSRTQNSNPLSDILHSPNSSRYIYFLHSSARNKRFLTASTPIPTFIITPFNESHIQAAIVCAKENGIQLRTRSGGHDYEGLSYVSYQKFMLIDLVHMRSINVDIPNQSAWVETGSTLGELYYNIAKKSNVHGFNAGTCPTVGVGGHISGGGLGTLSHKYGLAADSVIDAKMVDANGTILDRKSMGEDLFWAIRGGGAASFGIIFLWKVKLVSIPPNVTVFQVPHTLEEGGGELLNKWQTIAPQFPHELYMRAMVDTVHPGPSNNSTIRVKFYALFLGTPENLVSLMQSKFPELNLKLENCIETTWIRSVLFIDDQPIDSPLEVLLDRKTQSNSFFKAKSDYIKSKPIPESGLKGLYERLEQVDTHYLVFTPYGGRMSEISESEIPYPNRKGTLYQIQYMLSWDKEEDSEKLMKWLRDVHSYMETYVSKSPRSSSLNYRDLDLGTNNMNGSSFAEASVWGTRYYNKNFKRLAQVKSATDPSNFFRHEQSIPLL